MPAPGRRIPASNRANSGNTKSAYEAYLPRAGVARRRSSDLARAVHSTPETSSRPEDSVDTSNLFEKIPPVDPPADVLRKAAAPPVAPATPAPVVPAAPTTAENHSAAEGVGAITPPAPPIAAVIPQAPGIRRSASVAPSIGGGSVPSVEGLDWLREKGYKTFVDLRAGTEVEPTFADAVNDRGMVYISLPIVASRLDSNRLARFDDLISQSENRPVYFCDADGSRAGLVWYIHLRSVAGETPEVAASKAEEIGLAEAQIKIADAYLAGHKPRPKVALSSPISPASQSEPPPAPAIATAAEVGSIPEPTISADLTPSTGELPEPPIQLPASSEPPALPNLPGPKTSRNAGYRSDFLRDPASWRPVAALVLTGLGIPLAYWSRSAISVARTKVRRASLPAAERRSLEAPAASDA